MPRVELVSLRSHDTDTGAAALEATVAITGPATARLGRVLTLVWLNPAVHAVRWTLPPGAQRSTGACPGLKRAGCPLIVHGVRAHIGKGS